MPAALAEGIDFAPDGGVSVGSAFHRIEDAWMAGVAAWSVRGPGSSSTTLSSAGRRHNGGAGKRWTASRCCGSTSGATASSPPGGSWRADRVVGMAEAQAELVHRRVAYDLEVDTGSSEALVCAREIAARVR
ncbi:chloramphenicol 3-O phosphotransferase [Amycolatopsis regifaucium]|nr:chloramphenicol 3-O phosphotransferase [Amycolatopsis regifaucium]